MGERTGLSAECVRVQCHVSFQTDAGEMPNASLEISTVRAKTRGEEQHVPTATHPHGGSEPLTLFRTISFSPPQFYNTAAVSNEHVCVCVCLYMWLMF